MGDGVGKVVPGESEGSVGVETFSTGMSVVIAGVHSRSCARIPAPEDVIVPMTLPTPNGVPT